MNKQLLFYDAVRKAINFYLKKTDFGLFSRNGSIGIEKANRLFSILNDIPMKDIYLNNINIDEKEYFRMVVKNIVELNSPTLSSIICESIAYSGFFDPLTILLQNKINDYLTEDIILKESIIQLLKEYIK